MRTAGTQYRRTRRQCLDLFHRAKDRQRFAFHLGTNGLQRHRRKLAHVRHQILAVAGNAQGLHMFFDKILKLLHYKDLFNSGGKLADQIIGERIAPAQLQDRGFGEDLFHILIGDAVGDDAQLLIAPFDPVQR